MVNKEVPRIPEKINFVEEEEKVLQFWLKNHVFELSTLKSNSKEKYVLYKIVACLYYEKNVPS